LQDHEITITTLSEKKGYKMKKLTITTLLLLLLFSFTAYAGNGNSDGKYGKNRACSSVLSGASETITGTVIGIGNHDGLVVDTNNGPVTIYGIGPEWYWEDKEVDRPEIGDVVKVVAYSLLFSDGTRYIASSITIGDDPIDTLKLRDPETGCPLWRGVRNR
jgi:hypothetical protein